MNQNIFYKILFVFALIISTYTSAFCQKPIILGLTSTNELTNNNDFRMGVGVTCEKQITTHLGYETGLFYRTDKSDFKITVNETGYSHTITESYLSLPVLLKYYSTFLNASIGPSVDYYIGWRETSSNANMKITSYKVRPLMNIGIMGKISKAIALSDHIILEPEIRFNPFFKYNRYYAGIGIGLKYKP